MQNLAFLDDLACKINYSQQRYNVVILVLGGDTTPIVIVISKSLCLTKVRVNFHPNQVTLNLIHRHKPVKTGDLSGFNDISNFNDTLITKLHLQYIIINNSSIEL